MSSFLYHLGHRVARRPVRVLLAALLLGGLVAAVSVSLGGQLNDNLSIPGTESQAGLDALTTRFPEASGTSAQIVFQVPAGDTVARHRSEVRSVLQRVGRLPHVSSVVNPLAGKDGVISADGRVAMAFVQFDVKREALAAGAVDQLEAAAAPPPGSRLGTHVGGDALTATAVHVSPTEGIGVLVALLVLAITLGSLLAAGLPILTALLGVAVAMAGIFAAAATIDISSTTPSLALMIGLAVGIDYALFITSRHRSQLASGLDVGESIARALATAGSAVIFAGVTVIIALCGLVVARIPFLAIMGYAAASAVLVAVVVALTVVPALLAVAGERLRPKPGSRAARRTAGGRSGRPTMGARWVAIATRVPALTVVACLILLAILAIPAKDLALGLNDNGSAAVGSTERTTYDLISRELGPGYNAPLLVTADIITSNDPFATVDALAKALKKYDGVERVGLATPNRTADLGIVTLVPRTSQNDAATGDLVAAIRADRQKIERATGVSDLKVTGQTAVAIDVSDRLQAAVVPFALVVVGLSLVLLTIVFRSIAVPIKATVGYLLSVAASFGAVAAVFNWGWGADLLNVARTGPVISFLPIILMGVLFGLAMDYEVFLVSAMREHHVHGEGPVSAVRSGFAASARVVTAAAIIMIAVFAAFVPEGDSIIKPIALGLGFGVLVDAFVVRMTLVPAVLALLGARAWWLPAWLDKRLPVLDVEGAAVAHHVEHAEFTAAHGALAVRAEGFHAPGIFAPIDIALPPNGIGILRVDDDRARSALAAALAARFPSQGLLVVCDRLVPQETPAVRARVAIVGSVAEAAAYRQRPRASLVVVNTPAAVHATELPSLEPLLRTGASVLICTPRLVADASVAIDLDLTVHPAVPAAAPIRTTDVSSVPAHATDGEF